MNHTTSRGRPQARKPRVAPRQPRDYNPRIDDLRDGDDALTPVGDFPANDPKDLPADIVLARLRALGRRITGRGPWQAVCPAHPDSKPSLSLTETAEGVLLVRCWGGCETEDVLSKLGLDFRALYPSLYALQNNARRPQGEMHFQGGERVEKISEPTSKECREWKRLLRSFRIPRYALNQLAAQLKLPRESLLALGVGFNPDDGDGAWVFPERDHRGRIVGLLRRFPDGGRFAITGSTRGLTLPDYGDEPPAGPLYVVEGPTDTAALVSVGAFAVGRFSADGSAAERRWLTRLIRKIPDREIVVVGDNDTGAGPRGAKNLAAFLRDQLKRPVAWALPRKKYKDIREQVVAGEWHKGLRDQEVFQ